MFINSAKKTLNKISYHIIFGLNVEYLLIEHNLYILGQLITHQML